MNFESFFRKCIAGKESERWLKRSFIHYSFERCLAICALGMEVERRSPKHQNMAFKPNLHKNQVKIGHTVAMKVVIPVFGNVGSAFARLEEREKLGGGKGKRERRVKGARARKGSQLDDRK